MFYYLFSVTSFSHVSQLMPVERVSKLKHHQCGMSFHFRFLKLLSPSISDGIYEEDWKDFKLLEIRNIYLLWLEFFVTLHFNSFSKELSAMMKINPSKRSKFREISVARVLPAGIGLIHGYFRDMTAFKKGHAPCFLSIF